jgi:alkylmercury lyase
MLQAALPVRRVAFRSLLAGRPVSLDEIATKAAMSLGTVRRAARDVASAGMAEIDEETVVGMDGLTTRPTSHRITLGGVDLWTWCAYDIVGIAAARGSDAVGVTRCGHCGRGITVEIRRGDPGGDFVGWLPAEACSNVMAEFCPSALFFCSREHLEEWRLETDAGPGEALDPPGLAERGREEWRQLVA